jgi:putative oxidoreductase
MNTQAENAKNNWLIDVSLLVVRVIVGVIFVAHGSQKLFGAFGGRGLEQTVETMGPVLGYLVTIGEFFGGIGLVFGFLSRFSAAALIVIMIGAIAKVHWAGGFFAPKGFEYNLALIGLLVPILLCGPGRYSIARFMLPKSPKTGRPYLAIE